MGDLLSRVIVALALALIGIAVLIIIAPILLLAALAFLFLAWKRPSAAERVTSSHRLAPVPQLVRSTPMRFASALVGGAFLLTIVSVAVARPPARADETARIVDGGFTRDEATPTPTSIETQPPTPSPTERPTPTPWPSSTATPEPTPLFGEQPTGQVQLATVVSVTDGDTIRVLLEGENVPVRYIGIDTPEIQNGVEWMGAEATAANAGLVAGQQVVLEKDVSETDQYGRLLRYVWLDSGAGWLLVNAELLRQGYAQITTFPPDVKYADALFVKAQDAARGRALGLWGAPPTPVPTPMPTPPPAVIAPLVPQPPSNCDPSYPDFCLVIGIGDLDCGEVQWRRFTVRWDVPNPDPHGFDREGDGIGCES